MYNENVVPSEEAVISIETGGAGLPLTSGAVVAIAAGVVLANGHRQDLDA